MSALSSSLLVLGAAIVLIDFAVQAAHISNQTAVFGQVGDEMRSRVTTVYMTCYFLGGAAGSALTDRSGRTAAGRRPPCSAAPRVPAPCSCSSATRLCAAP
ncbi:hypothetical protein ABZS88_43470 [Streptomyces sp. NPDC005480]|uniref:hypothetical protein n=1 Tax=Streptomyces sp. NPDC005480 TaxID=3154880 RepID=UPI0033AD8F04